MFFVQFRMCTLFWHFRHWAFDFLILSVFFFLQIIIIFFSMLIFLYLFFSLISLCWVVFRLSVIYSLCSFVRHFHFCFVYIYFIYRISSRSFWLYLFDRFALSRALSFSLSVSLFCFWLSVTHICSRFHANTFVTRDLQTPTSQSTQHIYILY